MNLYVSRNGQTFGPYSADQAKSFLESKQLLETDFALVEGTTEWKTRDRYIQLPTDVVGVSKVFGLASNAVRNNLFGIEYQIV